ncbi:MAG: hypothetical protein AAB353_00200, partial [Candidatus Hydrogenedentota bacterium]
RVMATFRSMNGIRTTVSRAVPLAPNATKRASLYVPAPLSPEELIVQYQVGNARPLVEISIQPKPLGSDVPVLGLIGEPIRSLPPSENKGQTIFTRIFLQAENLPDRADGFDMFDALVIAPALETPLTSAQIGALREWIISGGMLIVDASKRTEAYRQEAFAELLPFRPTNTRQERVAVLDTDLVFAEGQASRARVLLESNGAPLVVERPYGLGAIVCFAFAIGDSAFVSWPDRDGLWRQILGARFTDIPDGSLVQSWDVQSLQAKELADLVSGAPSAGLRLGLVLLLTLIYAIAAGPGDYLLVKRLGRPRLTWLTFPAIVAVFTFAAWLGARLWIGGEQEVEYAERTVVFPELDTSLKTGITGIFFPRADLYRIADPDGPPPRPLAGLYRIEDPIRIDGDTGVISEQVPIWTHRAFASTRLDPNAPKINVAASPRSDTVELRIENQMDGPIDIETVLFGGSLWQVKATIPAGGSHRETLDRPAAGDNSYLSFDNRAHPMAGKTQTTHLGDAFARQFRLAEALRRGALIVTFTGSGHWQYVAPLTLNGEALTCSVTGSRIVVTYPEL